MALSPPQKHPVCDVAVNEYGDALGVFVPWGIYDPKELYFSPITKLATQQALHLIFPPPFRFYPDTPITRFIGNTVYFSFTVSPESGIIVCDLQVKTAWLKRFAKLSIPGGKPGTDAQFKCFATTPNSELTVVLGYGHDGFWGQEYDALRLFNFDKNGVQVWKKSYKIAMPGFAYQGVYNSDIAFNPVDSSYILIGSVVELSPQGAKGTQQIIIKLDKSGTPIWWKRVIDHEFKRVFVRNDGVYFLGRTKQPLPFSQNHLNAILCKMGHDLNPIWARAYSGEAFEYSLSSLNFLPDGRMVMGYSTTGAFPTVLATLAPDGQIQSQKGYPLYEPRLDVMPDGSLVMAARRHFDSTGIFFRSIIAKTDTDGNIDGCSTFPTCLEDAPVDVQFGDFPLEVITDSTIVKDYTVAVDSLQFDFEDFCGSPTLPTPDFYLPDTACTGMTLPTVAKGNRFAAQREWRITGPGGLDTLIRDSLNIKIGALSAGKYKIGQKIWSLGCAYEHERILTVLPPLELAILPEGTLCDGPPVELSASSNRPLSAYKWSNGEAANNISIGQEGPYWLTATDGHCTATDTAQIAFLSTKLDGQPPFSVPSDTTVCMQNLPFLLKPASLFSKKFDLTGSGATLTDSVFWLKTPGIFTVSTEIDGCVFAKKFMLGVVGCEPKIYFPTAFSPDGDGENDRFFPQGEGFRAIKLTVFDRWGNVWFEDSSPAPAWADERAHPGVFTYLFEYESLLDGSKNRLTGSVTVVR